MPQRKLKRRAECCTRAAFLFLEIANEKNGGECFSPSSRASILEYARYGGSYAVPFRAKTAKGDRLGAELLDAADRR